MTNRNIYIVISTFMMLGCVIALLITRNPEYFVAMAIYHGVSLLLSGMADARSKP